MTDVTKQPDPLKRAALHAARSILLGIDSLTTFAEMDAAKGDAKEAARKIRRARGLLHEAQMLIVDDLAVRSADSRIMLDEP